MLNRSRGAATSRMVTYATLLGMALAFPLALLLLLAVWSLSVP